MEVAFQNVRQRRCCVSVPFLPIDRGINGVWDRGFLSLMEAKYFTPREVCDWLPSIRICVPIVPTHLVILFSIAELGRNDLIDNGGCRVRY